MYAFAAWFPRRRRLVLSRDPVGVKPLYMALSEDGGHLAFSSEIKGFFGVEWFRSEPNRDRSVHAQFLPNGYAVPSAVAISWKGRQASIRLVPTLVDRVWQVCPGQILTFGPDGVEERWCTLSEQPASSDLLRDSVRSQLLSDVELGVQLSGGVSSSLVAHAYVSEGASVQGFHVSIRHPGYDEDEWVEIAAETIGRAGDFRLHRIEATEASFHDAIDDVAWYMDEPAIRHPNASGVYQLCSRVREETRVKALLTGEGADVMFGGHSWHDGRSFEGYDRSRRIFDLGDSPELAAFLSCPGEGGVLERQLAYDRAVYLPSVLARQERMDMAHGIETRVPFLSNGFLAMRAPLVPGKQALKRRAERIFGRPFARRDKCGFGFPLPWLGATAWDPSALEWLSLRVEPKSDLQRWALAALARWSALYLHGGWRARKRDVEPRKVEQPISVRMMTRNGPRAELRKDLLPPSETRVEIVAKDDAMLVARVGENEWKLDPSKFVDGEILREGHFEWSSVRWLPQIVASGARILDVGANFGYYSVILSRMVGDKGMICAFEPSRRFRERLEDHVARNHLRNVVIGPFGLSDRQQRLELFGGGSSATLQWHDDAVAPSTSEWIELRALDEIWSDMGLDRVDFVKIDIDGAEPFFFKGAEKTIRRYRPAMLVEFMEIALMRSGYSVRDLACFLDSCGYLLVSEETGLPWTSGASFLRDASNCSHSINVFALPREFSDPDYLAQHDWIASLPGIRQIAAESVPAPGADRGSFDNKLTTREYWEAGHEEMFEPWVVTSSPYSEILGKALPRKDDWTCAEIGAYPGSILCDLAKRFGYKPVAIEYSSHAERIEQMFECNGLRGRVENRDFLAMQEVGLYDVVCSFGFVEHFADPRDIVARHLRLTKPGGYTVISVPRIDGFQGALRQCVYLPDEWERISSSHNPEAMNLDTLRRLAGMAGDEIVLAEYLFGASIYFPWDADFVRPEMRWLVRYLNDLDVPLRNASPGAFHSPGAIVVVRRGDLPVPEDPRDFAALSQADSRLAGGRFEEAAGSYESCLHSDRGWLAAWLGLGRSFLAMGRFESAAKICLECPLVLPEALPVRRILGKALLGMGRAVEAAAVLKEIQAWAPFDQEIMETLEEATIASGRTDLVLRWRKSSPCSGNGRA
jgi:FkbM family methyltransferase